MKKKMTKQVRRIAREMTAFMEGKTPMQGYHDSATWKGSKLLEANVKEVDNKPVDPEKEYVVNFTSLHDVNLYRLLKKSLKRGGFHGMKTTVENIIGQYLYEKKTNKTNSH